MTVYCQSIWTHTEFCNIVHIDECLVCEWYVSKVNSSTREHTSYTYGVGYFPPGFIIYTDLKCRGRYRLSKPSDRLNLFALFVHSALFHQFETPLN